MSSNPQVSQTVRTAGPSGLARIAENLPEGALTADAIMIANLRGRAENAEGLLERQSASLRDAETRLARSETALRQIEQERAQDVAQIADLKAKVEAFEWEKAEFERRLAAAGDAGEAAALKAENADLRGRIEQIAEVIDGTRSPEVQRTPQAAPEPATRTQAKVKAKAPRTASQKGAQKPAPMRKGSKAERLANGAMRFDDLRTRAIAWCNNPKEWGRMLRERMGVSKRDFDCWRSAGIVPAGQAERLAAVEASPAPKSATFCMTPEIEKRLEAELESPSGRSHEAIGKLLSKEFGVTINKRTISNHLYRSRKSAEKAEPATGEASGARGGLCPPRKGRWGENVFMRGGRENRHAPPAPEGFEPITFDAFKERVVAMSSPRNWGRYWTDQTGFGVHLFGYWREANSVPAGYVWVLSEIEKLAKQVAELTDDEAGSIGEMLVTEPDLDAGEIAKRISKGRAQPVTAAVVEVFAANFRRLHAANRAA